MTDINIPPEALEGVKREIEALLDLTIHPKVARAACLAMLRAWPGMEYMMGDEAFPFHYIILPLPQEASDDVA